MGQVADSIARAGEQTLRGFGMVGQAMKEYGDTQMQQVSFTENQRRAKEAEAAQQQALVLRQQEQADTKAYREATLANEAKKISVDEQQGFDKNQQAANTLLLQRQSMLLDHEAKQQKETEAINNAAGMDIVRQGTNLYSTYEDFMKNRKDVAVGTATTARLPATEYARALDTHRKTLNAQYGSDVGEQKLKAEISTVNTLKSSVAMEIEGGTLHTRSLEQINTLFSNVRAQLPPTSPNLGYVDSLQVDTINQWKNMGGENPISSKWGYKKAGRDEGKEVFNLNKSAFSGGDPNAFKTGKIVRAGASE